MKDQDVGYPVVSNTSDRFIIAKKSDHEFMAIHLSDDQLNKVIESGSRVLPEAINILRGVVDIAKLRAEARSDIERIEADTRRIVQTTRAEIDRLRQTGENIRTRGEVVSRIVRDFTDVIAALPDFDSQARLLLISSLKDVLKIAVEGAI